MENGRLKIELSGYTKEDMEEWESLGIEFLLYAQCYEDALTAILSTIDENRDKRDRLDKANYKSVFAGMGEEYIPPLNNGNIIAFIGNRGSGKTTAINEFSKVLHFYHNNAERWNPRLSYKGKGNYRFHVITPIDASVLEAKEDLMEVILASMYQVFQRKAPKTMNNSDIVQKIVKEFEEAYQSYINVGKSNAKRSMYEETSLAKLKDMSNSLKTKNTIKKLTEHFLELLDGEEKSGDSYLVVVIDDLDMNPENGFAMLEQLYKYWSNERIVILIAIKYEQMKLMCTQHFVDCLTPKYGGIHENTYLKCYDKAKELSSDYLLKVIPLSNRIYMPERMLNDNGMVSVISGEKLGQQEDKYKVKEFVLSKIAAKMNIYYDAMGLKRHFCLPDTVRELVGYNSFLDTLHPMDEIESSKEERKMLLYDQNHEQFNGDIENRMAMRLLDDEQLEVYQLIQKRDLERRAKYAVNFLDSWMEYQNTEFMADKVDGRSYCYVDLLESIYNLGRKKYKDKALVHCLLASFTTEMVREYYSYKNNADMDARNRAARRLKAFLGNTFGGNWLGKTMPKGKASYLHSMMIDTGYKPDANMAKFIIQMQKQIIADDENKDGEIVHALSEVVLHMEIFMRLLSNYRNENGKEMDPEWKVTLNMGDVEEGHTLFLNIESKAVKATYDIWGFIGREIKEDRDKNILNSLTEPLVDGVRNMLREKGYLPDRIEDLSKQLENEICQNSIWEQEDQRAGIAFPFYNLDMSYNIMKRVKSRVEENVLLKEMLPYEYLRTVYGYIADELQKEGDFYRSVLKKELHFCDDFVSSPFIRVFEINNPDKDAEEHLFDTQIQKTDTWERPFFNEAIRDICEDIDIGFMDGQNIY